MNYTTDHPLHALDFLPNSNIPSVGYLFESEIFVASATIAAVTILLGVLRSLQPEAKHEHRLKRSQRRTTVVMVSLISLLIGFGIDFGFRYVAAVDSIDDTYRSNTTAVSPLTGQTFQEKADISVNTLALAHALVFNDTVVPGVVSVQGVDYKGGVEVINGTEARLYAEVNGMYQELRK